MKTVLTFGNSNTRGYDYDTYSPDTGVRGRFAFELNTVDGVHYSRNDHAKLAQAPVPIVRAMENA